MTSVRDKIRYSTYGSILRLVWGSVEDSAGGFPLGSMWDFSPRITLGLMLDLGYSHAFR